MKYLLSRNDGGVWGDEDDPDGYVVLRSTEIAIDGMWQVTDPATRALTRHEFESARLEPGDLLVTKSSGSSEHIGKTAVVDAEVAGLPAAFSNFMQRLRPAPGVEPRYLFHFLNSQVCRSQFQFLGQTTTGLRNLSASILGSVQVPKAPLVEQRAIADYLDRKTAAIDDLIRAKKRLIALLQEKRQALITQAVTKGLDPSVPMKDSGIEWLREVPAHWLVLGLRRLLEAVEQGWSPSCESYPAQAGEWGVLKVGCVNGPRFDERENKALPQNLEPRPEYEIRTGDLLMSRANSRELVGSAAIVGEINGRLMMCDKLFRLDLRSQLVDASYLELVLQSKPIRHQIEADATGSSPSMQNIGQDTVRMLVVPLPPMAEQALISQTLRCELNRIEEAAEALVESVRRLSELRQALVSTAVTGQIDVAAESTMSA